MSVSTGSAGITTSTSTLSCLVAVDALGGFVLALIKLDQARWLFTDRAGFSICIPYKHIAAVY